MMTRPRVRLPEAIKAGDVVEVKTLVSHVMETGRRKDKTGNTVPRNIIHTFTASFAGKPVFRAELLPGIAANPFLAFFVRIPHSGTLELTWAEDKGSEIIEKIEVAVI